jgi:hypothetical protein
MIYLLSAAAIAIIAVFGFWLYTRATVETVDYAVTKAEGSMEIRDYPALVIAEVARSGGRDAALRAGFSPLAGYIFAKERPGDKIAMTAPVIQTGEADDWQVSFVMPAGSTLESLPEPVRDGVKLRSLPPRQRAAIRFSGVADDAMFAEKEGALRAWLSGQGIEAGAVTLAYYDDPMTPGFLRRNEVLLDIVP